MLFFSQVESEDNLPVNFDIHVLLDLHEDERRSFLSNMLKDCPSEEVQTFMDKYLERIHELNPYL